MTIANDFFDRLAGTWQNKIDGVWQDHFGWNVISQPKPDAPGTGDFELNIDQMRETVTFKKLGGRARNVGISGQAGFWEAMAYEIDIVTPSGNGIHHEMGHFLIHVLESGETPANLFADVVRQASIPRANVMATMGELHEGSISKAISDRTHPFYNAKPLTSDGDLQATINAAFSARQTEIDAEGGPSLEDPLVWLETILAPGRVGRDWEFAFRRDTAPTQMTNGQRVVNPVAIGNLLSDFWIAKRRTDAAEIDILQYAQTVGLTFHGIEWPHIAVNSLIKQT